MSINKLKTWFNGHYSIILMYGFVSSLFFVGATLYQIKGVYSDQLILLFIQILLYGLIINCILATVFTVTEEKTKLIICNAPIIFAIYFNLVFQFYPRINFDLNIINYIVSMLFALIFLFIIIYLTGANYFTEKVWSMAIYFSLINIFDLPNNKYFTLLFIIILSINFFFKFQAFFQKILYNRLKEFFPEIDKANLDNPFYVYGTLSIVYWCCIYYIGRKVFKNNLVSFISLGFFIPNIAIIIQYRFPNTHAIIFTFIFYLFFNLIMVKAEIHANNVISKPQVLENLDNMLEKLLKKHVKFWGIPTGTVNKMWGGFKQVAKTTASYGGGPGNWGPKAGGVVGFGTSVYFANHYVKNGAEANKIAREQIRSQEEIAREQIRSQEEIAREQLRSQEKISKDQLEAQEKSTAAQLQANKVATEQLEETKRSNDLLHESNQHAARGANAAEVYNKIAKEQNDNVTEIE